MNNDDNFAGVSGTGVVIAWDKSAGNTSYIKGSVKDLSMLPIACAKWDKVSDIAGIAYENGTNKGFITVDGITVTDGRGISTPQATLLEIYPNPVTTELNIKFVSIGLGMSCKLTDKFDLAFRANVGMTDVMKDIDRNTNPVG